MQLGITPRLRCSCINPLIVMKFLSSVHPEYCLLYVLYGEISGVRTGSSAT